MLKKFTDINIQDINLNRVQSNVSSALKRILLNPVLDFNIEKNVNLVIGDNVVNHRLSRPPLGWFVVRKRGPADLYDKQDSNTTPQTNIIINSDAVVSVDIYFF